MPKATPSQISRLGFAPAQFGAPDDWLAAGGYVAEILDSVAEFVRDEVGGTAYDGAAGLLLQRITEAEKAFCAAELWRRRAAFLDASANLGNSDSAFLAVREYYSNADREEQRALALLAKAAGRALTGGMAVGVVVSGRFAGVGQ